MQSHLKRTLITSSAILLVAALAVIAPASELTPEEVRCQTAFRLHSASATRGTIEVLELLRGGKINAAIHILEERELGLAIADMKMVDGQIDLHDNSTITITLLRAKEYRERFPRVHSDPRIEEQIRLSFAQVDTPPEWLPPAKPAIE